MSVSTSQAQAMQVKAGKSLEFSPDDSSQGSRGAVVQSPYQIQSKLIHQI